MNQAERTVIFFQSGPIKRYVSETSVRPDNKIVPLYSNIVEDAKDYGDQENALRTIDNIHNLYNREFITEKVIVGQSRRLRFDFLLENDLT